MTKIELSRRDLLKSASAFGLVAAGATRVSLAASEPQPLSIDHEPQLFLDDWIVADSKGLKRVLHQPEKKGLIREGDGRPWERGSASTVVRDAQGRFHMSYSIRWFSEEALKAKKHFPAEGTRSLQGYAVSDDGIRWKKPVLGLVDGPTGFRRTPKSKWKTGWFWEPTGWSKDNSYGYPIQAIRDLGVHAGAIDRDRRYMVFAGGLHFARDVPDVLGDADWRDKLTPIPDAKTPRGGIIGWDEEAQLWLAIGQSGGWQRSDQGRVIARWTSRDLKTWSDQEIVLPIADDESKKPDDWVEYYYMSAYRVGGLWLGSLILYHTDRSNRQYEHPTMRNTWMKGTTDIRLMVSRDAARTWRRVAGKQVWLPHHEEEDGYDRSLYAGAGPLRVGDEMWMYYRADDGDHIGFRKDNTPFYKDRTRIGRTALAVLRWNGYVSLHARGEVGSMTTHPLITPSGQLTVNAAAAQGTVRVAVEDASGKALPGYGLAECKPIRADEISEPVHWRGRAQLPRGTAERPLRFRFEVRDADLYGFQIGEPGVDRPTKS